MKLTLTSNAGEVHMTWELASFGNLRKEFPQRLLCRAILAEIEYYLPRETLHEQEGVNWEPLSEPAPLPVPVPRAKPKPTKADTKFVEGFLSSLSPEEVLELLKGE